MVNVFPLNGRYTQLRAETLNLNATIVDCGSFFIVIDTLLLAKDTRVVKAWLEAHQKPLRYLINTHWHSDHCYGNKTLYNPETLIIAHNEFQKTLISERDMFKTGQKSVPNREHVMAPQIRISGPVSFDGDIAFSLYPVPGHSPDSLAIYFPDDKVLVSGDTVLSCPHGFSSIPYFYWGNPYQMLESLTFLKTLNIEYILSGHGEISGVELLNDHYEYISCLLSYFEDIKDKNINSLFLIQAEDCLPIIKHKKLWVNKMHELNLQKLYEIKMNGESCYG